MTRGDRQYNACLNVLKHEMILAAGCTEPVAIALATAKAKAVLGAMPERIRMRVSENVLKNAKSVIVPNTNAMKGIRVAAAAGAVIGDPAKDLEILGTVDDDDRDAIVEYLKKTQIVVSPIDSEYVFDVEATVYHGEEHARVRLINAHTNIALIEKNGVVQMAKDYAYDEVPDDADKKTLTVEGIVAFADALVIDDVKALFDRQIETNMAIAEEGLTEDFGATIGKIILTTEKGDVKNIAKGYAAAASDARMGGSKKPVTIVSGSGNQGITASVPLIVYAREKNIDQERLYRALAVSNLISIHQKTGVGALSAYCGAVFAGAAAGAGIAYMEDGSFEAVAHTLVNALAIVSGMVCDGAKASCAAKIASSVDAGIFGFRMHQQHREFLGGEGLVAKGVENTIANIKRLAREGMCLTDKEIIRIMSEEV